jgi:peroxiredoxin Q/BCP
MISIEDGLKAPDFTLPGSDGNTYTLSSFIGKNIVLFFYPKDNTPG